MLALATTDVAALVVTIRSGAPLPDAVTALWKARGLELIELQPLGHRDVCRLVARLLEGPVHAAAYERINDLSRGNPLYVRELVHDARSTAALHQTGGLWCWREELLAFDRLRVLVERRTREASAEALQALELVAVGAPIPYPVLCELASPAAVEELERLGLVTVRGAGRPPSCARRTRCTRRSSPSACRRRPRRACAARSRPRSTATRDASRATGCGSRSGCSKPATATRRCSWRPAGSPSRAVRPTSACGWPAPPARASTRRSRRVAR